ncbi:hypothetical protein ACWDTI_17650 [Gordonia sp. NPDC003424]
MSDHFLIEPELFERYTKLIGTLGDKLKDASLMLTTGLHHEGECWGDDDPGHAFEGAYSPKAKAAFSNSHSVATHLNKMHAAMEKALQHTKDTEAHNIRANTEAGR